MKIKILLLLSLSPFLLFSLSPCLLFSQYWDTIVQQPWFYGNVDGKLAYVYLESNTGGDGYFFVADRAQPNVYQLDITWKLGDPNAIKFKKDGKKIKAKFSGVVQEDTLSGLIRTSRKNAIRLGISPELPIFMVKEIPNPNSSNRPIDQSTNRPITQLPRFPASPLFNKCLPLGGRNP